MYMFIMIVITRYIQALLMIHINIDLVLPERGPAHRRPAEGRAAGRRRH